MMFLAEHISIVIAVVLALIGIGIFYHFTKKLKKSEELWKFALEGAGDGVWDWDVKNDIARFSDRYKQMFGFTDNDIKTDMKRWKNRIHPDDMESLNTTINNYLSGHTEKYVHEHRVICKDKSFKWVLSRGMIVERDNFGNPTRMVGTHTDITERKELEHRLDNLAHYDSLTGLPNRTLLSDRLKQALVYTKREKKMLAVMFVDLDHFKEVNDFYGHKIGDKLLKKISQRIVSCVRESDTVARIGGDEFIVLLPNIENLTDATTVAEKIIKAVVKPIEIVKPSETFQPVKVIQKNLHVSASIGVAIYPKHGKDEKLLVINADLAMYQAKNSGKNRAQVFDPAFAEQQRQLRSSGQ